jgi:tetratricopeptide (TPR) repeat protein
MNYIKSVFFWLLILLPIGVSAQEGDFSKGLKLLEEKKLDSAEFVFQEVIRIENSPEVKALCLLQLALIQSQRQQPQIGIKYLDEALTLDEKYLYYFYRGRLNYQDGKARKAIKDYTSSLALNPQHAQSYFHRGIAKYWNAKLEDGCTDMSKAVELGDTVAMSMMKKLCK